jgi:nucleoside-diphosphate-sugar epimerase
MRVLIAGASGYIGSRLSSFLADAGFEIIALCNKNVPEDEDWQKKMYRILQADVSLSLAAKQLDIDKLDAIINLISLDHNDSNGYPDHVNSVNVSSGWNLLDTFSDKGFKKYIYFSTIHVYGGQLIGEIDEKQIPKPANKYGLTHLLSENIVNYYACNTDVEGINIRLSNGYGSPYFTSNKCWNLVINNLCLNAWQKQEIILKSDGTPLRDFIHLSDILKGVEKILLNLKVSSNKAADVINFSSGQTISMLDAAMTVKSVFEAKYNKTANVFINENTKVEKYTKSDTNKYKLINAKFKKLMRGEELCNLRDGINDIFNFLDNNSNAAFS